MSNAKVLQPFVSRFESLRVRLHNETFRRLGTSIFEQEGIPYTGRSSPHFAKEMVQKFAKQALKFKQKKYIVYELGCGNGLLALFFLDILQISYPEIYSTTYIYLFDNSELIIRDLKKSAMFSHHQERVFMETTDVLKLNFQPRPFFVYFVNLLDSLSCRHIRVENNKAFEIKISTLQKDNNILEATGLVPIEEIVNIKEVERNDLKKYLDYLPKNQTYVFNYSFVSGYLIQNILKKLIDHGLLMISDFGISTTENRKFSLWSQYGRTIFFSVDFDYIKYVAQTSGVRFKITNNHPQEPQEIWLER